MKFKSHIIRITSGLTLGLLLKTEGILSLIALFSNSKSNNDNSMTNIISLGILVFICIYFAYKYNRLVEKQRLIGIILQRRTFPNPAPSEFKGKYKLEFKPTFINYFPKEAPTLEDIKIEKENSENLHFNNQLDYKLDIEYEKQEIKNQINTKNFYSDINELLTEIYELNRDNK